MPRPAKPLLSVDAIVDAAMILVDEVGDFSFPKVARILNVSQSALYNHIDNREHIIELMHGRLYGQLRMPPLVDLPWEDALRTLLSTYREGLAAHPRLVPLLITQTVRDLGVVGLYEQLALTLERAGLRQSQIGPAIATVDYLALGAALDLTAQTIVWSPPEGQFPALQRAVTSVGDAKERVEAAFLFSVEVLVSGVRAQAEPEK